MFITLTLLIAAHFVADFLLQPQLMIKHKKNPFILIAHVAIVVGVASAAIGGFPVCLLFILALTHLIMDAYKTYLMKDGLLSFILDQTVHLIVVFVLAFLYPTTFQDWWWAHWMNDYQEKIYAADMTLLTGALVNLAVGAVIIKKATARFSSQIRSPISGLKGGGEYIGYLERAMVMLFILISQPAGVGFLITAKSILRFGDVKNTAQRRSTEYIIIGTFMSFGWSLVASIVTLICFTYWWPTK